jgi:hypothetical protein
MNVICNAPPFISVVRTEVRREAMPRLGRWTLVRALAVCARESDEPIGAVTRDNSLQELLGVAATPLVSFVAGQLIVLRFGQ